MVLYHNGTTYWYVTWYNINGTTRPWYDIVVRQMVLQGNGTTTMVRLDGTTVMVLLWYDQLWYNVMVLRETRHQL